MEQIDARVARAVFTARLIERALHDFGPWEISWGPLTVPALVTITEDAVTFTATFPDACHLGDLPEVMELRCRGEMVSTRAVSGPGDGAFVVTWRLDLGDRVPA